MYPFENLRFIETEPTMGDICDSENLLFAWTKVSENNGCAGVDDVTVEMFARNAQGNLVHLQEDLLTGAYRPLPLLRFYVDKGKGGQRALSIPTVRDRIVQQAITAVLTPKLDAIFENCSYGYRKGKGRTQAIEEIIRLRDAGYTHVFDADIADYFDNVDHWILIQRVSDLVPEESVVRLVAMLLTSKVVDGPRQFTLRKGLPQGSPLSPLLSNLYLDLFDKVMCQQGYHLIRYVDDFVILERHQISVQHALQLTQHMLAQLKLKLKPEKSQIVTFQQGFRYLGVLFLGEKVHTTGKDNLKLPSSTNLTEAARSLLPSGVESNDLLGQFGLTPDASVPQKLHPVNPVAINDSLDGILLQSQPDFSDQTDFGVQHSEADLTQPLTPTWSADASNEAVNVEQPSSAVQTDSFGTAEPEPSVTSILTQQLNAMEEAIRQLRDDNHRQNEGSEPVDSPMTVSSQAQSMGTSRLLSTLYIHEQGSTLSLSEKRFIVRLEKQALLEVPAIKIAQIVILGQCQVTTPAIRFCLKAGIPICFLSQNGSYYGRLGPPTANQVLLQQRQFLASADSQVSLKLAKSFVEGKIHNQRVMLQRRLWKIKSTELGVAIDFLADIMTKFAQSTTLDELRGYEGTASARYFSVFGLLLDEAFSFSKRIKHPPTDPVNAMLSFGYTLLFHNIQSLVEAHNLHPYCGHLHALRDGHPALVSDLIEEFRALLVDPLVIYLINNHVIKPTDFDIEPGSSTPCRLATEARKTFVQQFEAKMQSTVTHPHTGYTVDYRRCIDLQITQLVQCLRGERETYQPMKGKA